jgi:peptidoglycan/xylan/chitin deacetylase (PgdA/CDA1 family)
MINSINKYTIMFHNLAEDSMARDGSVKKGTFFKILEYAKSSCAIQNPSTFVNHINQFKDISKNILITFDDGLKCHWDCAIPWLEELQLKAIFFVHTQPITDGYDYLICVKKFCAKFFRTQSDFYNLFNHFYVKLHGGYEKIAFPGDFLSEYTFYTPEEKMHRYIRDIVLSTGEYLRIIEMMMKEKKTSFRDLSDESVFLNADQIGEISAMGHLIGLHTHTHPTNITKLSFEEQRYEFGRNKQIIEEITNKKVTTASYPCGRYNADTLKVLKSLDLSCAFTSSTNHSDRNPLLLPRQDPAKMVLLP